MRVVCTVCSKDKSQDAERLPASERYLGKHIALAGRIAQEEEKPFFILSGRFGLVRGEDPVPYYDERLEKSGVERLRACIRSQIQHYKLSYIEFYYEEKDTWQPYKSAMVEACIDAGIHLDLNPI